MDARGLTWVRRPYRGGSWALVRAPNPGFVSLNEAPRDHIARRVRIVSGYHSGWEL